MSNYDVDSIRTGYSRYDRLSSYDKVDITDEFIKTINLPVVDTYNVDNWYFKNGKYYYFKKSKGVASIINELLAEDFYRFMGLPTVSYELIDNEDGVIIGLLSENVRKSGVICRPCRFLNKSEQDYINRVFFDGTFECDKRFKRDLTYYVVGNYYSTLRDRYINSEIIVKEDGFEIPPLLDFESCFFEHLMEHYSDPMISFTFDSEMISSLKEENEFFLEALDRVMEYRIIDGLNRIEKKHQISIPSDIKSYYCQYNDYRKFFMENMGLLRRKTK